MDLSILVVAYNSKNLVDACIRSVLLYKGKYQIEIIVVDNNSPDGTKDHIKKNYPQIKAIYNTYNYGFAVGMNQAYKWSDGKFVMTFNPDAEINEQAIDKAINFLTKNNQVGLLGMLTEDSNGHVEIPHHEFNLLHGFNSFKPLFKDKAIIQSKETQWKEVEWLWGTSIFARKEVLGNSFFMEDNFLFWEEYWLCKKIKEKKLKIVVLLNCKMLHHISASFKNDTSKLELVRTLSNVNGHIPKINEFGLVLTKLSYLIKVFDYMFVITALSINSILKADKVAERRISLINNKAHLKSFFNLFIRGKAYRRQIQYEAIVKLNNGTFPVYPPKTVI